MVEKRENPACPHLEHSPSAKPQPGPVSASPNSTEQQGTLGGTKPPPKIPHPIWTAKDKSPHSPTCRAWPRGRFWLPWPFGIQPGPASPTLIPPASGHPSGQGRFHLVQPHGAAAPGCSDGQTLRLQKGVLWAGIVTAFNLTRVDTSFKTIPFCLFSGDFLHIPVGKEEHFWEVQFLSVFFFFFIFSIGTLKHGECASQCFVCLKFFPVLIYSYSTSL